MGNLREGAEDMRSALDVIEKQGDAVSIAMVSDFLAMTYARLGEFDKAEQVIARAEQTAGHGDAIARVDVDISKSVVLLERGETEKARVQASVCSQRAEDLGAFACVVAANTMFGAASLVWRALLGRRVRRMGPCLLGSPLLPTDHRDSPQTVTVALQAVNTFTTTSGAPRSRDPAVEPHILGLRQNLLLDSAPECDITEHQFGCS
jgi:hypothetical protein